MDYVTAPVSVSEDDMRRILPFLPSFPSLDCSNKSKQLLWLCPAFCLYSTCTSYTLQGNYLHQPHSLSPCSLLLSLSLTLHVSLNDFLSVSLPPPLSPVSVSVPIASLSRSVTYSRWCIDCTQTLAFPLARKSCVERRGWIETHISLSLSFFPALLHSAELM